MKKKKLYGELIGIRGINAYGYGPIIDTHSVSEQSLPRLYLFLNTLFKAVEDAGGKVVVKERLGSQFVLQGHEINFSCKEKYKLALLPENENKKRRDDERIYAPSGQLTFMLTAKTPLGHRYQQEWKEGSKSKLEDFIKNIFVAICEIPAYMEHLKAEYVIRLEREIQESEQRRQIQERHDDELKATKSLIHEAQLWHLSQQLQEYISSIPVTKDNLEWLKWARKKVDWLNPLVDCDDKMLSEADKKALLKSDEQYQYKYVPVHKF